MRAAIVGSVLLNVAFSDEVPWMDGFEETFGVWSQVPRSEQQLRSAGWTKAPGDCDEHTGFAWTESAAGPTPERPTTMFTNAAGQPAGVGVTLFGGGDQRGYEEMWQSSANSTKTLQVAFREKEEMCSSEPSAHKVGTAIIVNPRGPSLRVPLREPLAEQQGWHVGSCIPTMGTHWMLDTHAPSGQMTYDAQNFFPVVPMYDLDGSITAMFFQTWKTQVSRPVGQWDENPTLPVAQMCNNTCDHCGGHGRFSGTDVMHTLHFWFVKHAGLTCGSMRCNGFWCCPAAGQEVVI